jgi:hypothetical protein
VARLKIADLVSIKMAPQPTLKLSAMWGLPGTGMALRFRYECPFNNLREFWHPPARLMLRCGPLFGGGRRALRGWRGTLPVVQNALRVADCRA